MLHPGHETWPCDCSQITKYNCICYNKTGSVQVMCMWFPLSDEFPVCPSIRQICEVRYPVWILAMMPFIWKCLWFPLILSVYCRIVPELGHKYFHIISHNKTNKGINDKIIFHTQFIITPKCFDLSCSSSGSYWTSLKHIQNMGGLLNTLKFVHKMLL